MSKNVKILVGLLTFLPLVGLVAYIWFFIQMFVSITNAGAPDSVALGNNIMSIFVGFMLAVVTNIGLLIFYIVHAVKNKSLTSDERLMWVLLFIFISTIAFIIYWVLKIWSDEKAEISVGGNEI